MDEPTGGAKPYEVTYSGRVRQGLEALLMSAVERGLGEVALSAAKEFHRRLRIYPQFGQPLRDLAHRSGQLWIGVVPPFVAHYVLFEEERLVMVVVPFTPLRRSGLD